MISNNNNSSTAVIAQFLLHWVPKCPKCPGYQNVPRIRQSNISSMMRLANESNELYMCYADHCLSTSVSINSGVGARKWHTSVRRVLYHQYVIEHQWRHTPLLTCRHNAASDGPKRTRPFCRPTPETSEWVSSFLTTRQLIIGQCHKKFVKSDNH